MEAEAEARGSKGTPAAAAAAAAAADAARVEDVLKQLTVKEKVGLLSGSGMWTSNGVPRLDIPQLCVTDGPHGARGLSLRGDANAFLAPCELALAATFDMDLIEQVGEVLGMECRRRGSDILLGPCLNLQRFPNTGRHFECFSEDPYLSARAGVAYIRGVQKNAIACAKHFVCNDQETDRGTVDAVVDEQTLREVYLQPFEAAVMEAGVGSVMCGYNRLNGKYCTENSWLLENVLRGEWKFPGLVMSDWFGNQSMEPALRAGLNLEMPGVEPRHYGGYLAEAAEKGQIPEELLDERCRPMLRALLRTGRDASGRAPPQSEVEEKLLERAAAEACVLLRNHSKALPLRKERLRKVAVIGPNAANTVVQGGGSSRVHPKPCQSILAALREALEPQGVEVAHHHGCSWEYLPSHMRTLEVMGLASMGGCDAAGQPLTFTSSKVNDLALKVGSWLTNKELFRRGLMPVLRHCGWRQTTPEEATKRARKSVSCSGGVRACSGPSARSFDPSEPMSSTSSIATRHSEGSVSDECRLLQAVATAAEADATVLVLGTHGTWELEGVDQPHMELLSGQTELVRRVAAASKGPVIVVLNVGSPKELPWLDSVDAVLLAHFGGQGMARAVASLLLGELRPTGRLPTTWPQDLSGSSAGAALEKLEDAHPVGKVLYAEGRRVGYRGAEDPLFHFGFGLSYTRFECTSLEVGQQTQCDAEGGATATAKLSVRNVGEEKGCEVIQLYLESKHGPRSLCGFRRTRELAPQEEEVLAFELTARELGSWFDVSAQAWQPPAAGDVVRIAAGTSAAAEAEVSSAQLVLK